MLVLSFLAAILLTVAAGSVLATLASGDRRGLRPSAELAHKQRPTAQRADAVAFEPIDLAPTHPVPWPSEVSRPSAHVLQLEWPSAQWDDEYFGKHAAAAPPPMVDSGAAWRASAANAPKPSSQREARANTPRPPPKRAAKAQPALAASAAEDDFFAPEPQAARARPPAPAEPKPTAPKPKPGVDVPSSAEIRALVTQRGLAGAVEEIRARTGWEFRDAANHLAKALRDT